MPSATFDEASGVFCRPKPGHLQKRWSLGIHEVEQPTHFGLPKFTLINGELTAYAMRCGYLQQWWADDRHRVQLEAYGGGWQLQALGPCVKGNVMHFTHLANARRRYRALQRELMIALAEYALLGPPTQDCPY